MKSILNTLVFIQFLLINSVSFSQEYFGTTIFGDTSLDIAFHSAKDSNGNIYATGLYSGTLTLGGATISWAGGNADGFLSKHDSNGTPIWIKGFGSGFDDVAVDVAVDANDNIYLTGYFQGAGSQAFDADPGPGVFILEQLSAILSRDCFIIKLDSNGDFLWAKQVSNPYGGAANEDAQTIEVDSDGNVYIAGSFIFADFDPSPTESVEIFASNGMAGTDGFLLKLDTDGNYVWVKILECLNNASINDMELDENNNIYITGKYETSIDLDPSSSNSDQYTSNGDHDVFIAKLSSDGDYVWGNSFGGANLDFANVIKTINSNVYLGGMFSGEVDLDPSNGTNTVTSNGDWDAFMSKFDESGNYNYSYTIGGEDVSFEEVYSIREYTGGDILLSGSFNGTTDFDNDTNEEFTTSNGDSDNFLLQINNTGEYQSHITIGGIDSEIRSQFELNDSNDIIYFGTFRSPNVDFNPFTGTDIINNIGFYDVYFSRFSIIDSSGISEINTDNLLVFPNPIIDIIHIKNAENVNSFKLISITGQLLLEGMLSDETIDVSSVPQGFYLLNLYGNNTKISKKIYKM